MRSHAQRIARSIVILLGCSAALTGLTTSPALAADTNVLYTLVSGDSALGGRLGTDSTPCTQDGTAGTFRYRVAQFTVSATGNYSFADVGSKDGRLGIYASAVNTSDLAAGCLAFFDSATPANLVGLTAGTTYRFLMTAGVDNEVGDYGFVGSGVGSITVLADTQTTLNSAPDPSIAGKPVTLTAQVTGGTPTGSVQFFDGNIPLGTSAVSADGIATLVTTSLPIGTRTLKAAYAGDATTTTSIGTTVHVVKRGKKPEVTLTVSKKQVAVGAKIKLTWKSKRADELRAKGSWRGVKPPKGTKTLKVKSLGVHIYKLKATNASGKDSARVKVIAVRGPKEFPVTIPTTIVENDTDLSVRSTGFDAKERFKVFLDDVLLIKGFADKKGEVRTLAPIPKNATEGPHVLRVVGANPNRAGEVEIQVIRAKTLTLEVEAPEVSAKTNQVVTVTGLVAGETITLLLDGETLVEGVADATGTFTHTFNVGKKKGERTVTAVGQISSRTGEVAFTVVASTGL